MQTEHEVNGKKELKQSENKISLGSIATNYNAPVTVDVLRLVREKARKDGVGKNRLVKQQALVIIQRKRDLKENDAMKTEQKVKKK